jgi:hypothetical protein
MTEFTAQVHAYKRGIVEAALREGYCNLQFFKLDGELREMVGTKNLDFIPQEYHPTGDGRRPQSDTTVTVFDVAEQGWRSFVLENLITIEKEVEYA